MNDALLCMLASEEVLAKNWLSKEDEEAWKDLWIKYKKKIKEVEKKLCEIFTRWRIYENLINSIFLFL